MGISSNNLDAFSGVVKYKTFSAASKALFVTQSALSQRVLNLEDELGVTLFIREKSGIRLTEAGEKLLRYTQVKEKLEEGMLESLHGSEQEGLRGELKVGTLSSLTRSVLFPVLDELVRANPNLHLEIYSRELSQLTSMSRTGEVDLVVSYEPVQRQGWEHQLLGYEHNVLCKSSKSQQVPERYFDHDMNDQTTLEFFHLQGQQDLKIKRDFLHDIYHIIEAVERGWGKAVIPKHMIKENKQITICKKFKTLKFPVYLSLPELSYYPETLKQGVEAIQKAKNILK